MEKKKVAAYARVSSNSRTQEHSYEFQSRYWNDRLGTDENYEYVGLFADKGISGKFAERRPQFMALMDACRNGKVDIVFTKSVQRFARNTEELLTMVHELREKGVAVYFEKENINTLNPDSELFLTVAAAIAEDDLNRYSNNVAWSIQDRFQKGECIIGPRLYGYVITKEKNLLVNLEEAKIVKEIFELYATGNCSSSSIAKRLNERQVPSPLGGIWHDSQIRAMLKNEKYIGDMLLQKEYTEKGKRKINRGERDSYYVENNHEPIVDRELWGRVQTVIEKRSNAKLKRQTPKVYPFTGLIVCGECGSNFTHKVNNSGTQWRAGFWKCARGLEYGVKVCGSTGIKETVINDLFVECYNEFISKGYMALKNDENDLEEQLNALYADEKELTLLSVRGLISQCQYESERGQIHAEIAGLQQHLKGLRYSQISASEFKSISAFDENKLHRFIRKVIIRKWVVTFEFYNGVQISRTYTNGHPGNIKDWKLKQAMRRENGDGR